MAGAKLRSSAAGTAALCTILWGGVGVAQDRTTPSPGTGTLYVGSFAKGFSIIDEATSTIVGTIPYKSGTPRRTVLSADRTRFYAMEADMEIIEIGASLVAALGLPPLAHEDDAARGVRAALEMQRILQALLQFRKGTIDRARQMGGCVFFVRPHA